MSKLHDRTRALMEASGISRYRISADTGIDQTSLSLFVHGKRGLSIARIEIILDYLGYEIEVVRKESS